MLKETLLLVVIFHLSTLVQGLGPRTEKVYPRLPVVYDINLDLSYEDRWREVMAGKRDLVISMYDLVMEKSQLPSELLSSVNYTVLAAHDLEYANELLAIANLLNLTFEQLSFLNTFFDAAPRCTGFIIQDLNDNIYHGRNLDYFFSSLMEPMLFQGRYFKDGKLVYEAINKYAEIGILTAVRKGAFTLNLNEYLVPFHYSGNGWEVTKTRIKNIYDHYLKGYADSLISGHKTESETTPLPSIRTGSLMLGKRVVELCETFDEAVDMILNGKTVSKGIYVLTGTEGGQGVVITRGEDKIHHVEYLDPAQGKWFLAQANYRRDIYDPPDDPKRTIAEAQLRAIGRENITKDLLWTRILEKFPIFSNGTLHSTVMEAKTGEFKTLMWGWAENKEEVEQIENQAETLDQ